MMKLADMTVTGFADIVSSDAPAPGGGSCGERQQCADASYQ